MKFAEQIIFFCKYIYIYIYVCIYIYIYIYTAIYSVCIKSSIWHFVKTPHNNSKFKLFAGVLHVYKH